MKKEYLVLFFVLLAFSESSFSQQVTGKVYSSEGTAFGSVAILYSTPDSSRVYSTIVQADSIYMFRDVKPGQYKLHIRSLGYRANDHYIAINNDVKHYNTEDIILESKVDVMKDIAIIAIRQKIEYERDKVILNVKGTELEDSQNLVKALLSLPGVSIGENNRVEVFGKQNVQIRINGKETKLTIENIPLSIIKSVEILSNPGSQYGGEVEAIVNIVTNDWSERKFSSSSLGTLTQGRYLSKYINQTFTYGSGKFNTLLNGYMANNESYINRQFDDRYKYNNSEIRRMSDEYNHNYNKYYYIYAESNLAIKSNLLVGTNIEYGQSKEPSEVRQEDSFIGLAGGFIDSSYVNNSFIEHRLIEKALGAFLDYSIDSSSQVSIKANYYGKSLASENINNFNLLRGSSNEIYLLNKSDLGKSGVYSIQSDLNKVSGKFNLTGGLKYSVLKQNLDTDLYSGIREIDSNKLNFESEEHIKSVYAKVTFSSKILEAEAGLRIENTAGDLLLVSDSSYQLNYNYLNKLPAFSLSLPLRNSKSIFLSYTKKIIRTPLYSRSPYLYYISPIVLYKGNAELDNQQSHNIDVRWVFGKNINTTIFLRDIRNSISTLTYIREGTTIIQPNNYDYKMAGASMSLTNRVTDYWSTTNKLTVMFSRGSGSLKEEEYTFSNVRLSLYSKQFFPISATSSIQLEGWYNSPYYNGNSKITFYPSLDVTANKRFFDNRIELGLSLLDLLNTEQKVVKTNSIFQNSAFIRNDDTHKIQIRITYNISKGLGSGDTKGTNIIDSEKQRL